VLIRFAELTRLIQHLIFGRGEAPKSLCMHITHFTNRTLLGVFSVTFGNSNAVRTFLQLLHILPYFLSSPLMDILAVIIALFDYV